MSKNKALSQEMIMVEWKNRIFDIFEMRFGKGNVNREELEKQLDEIIAVNARDPSITVVNNYRNAVFETTVSGIAEYIWVDKPIIGGDGVLFQQPDLNNPNPLVSFILSIMSMRDECKRRRKSFDDNSAEWAYYDLMQLNYKILINTLYGVLGYAGFPLYNLFLAQSVTAFGRNIISTASISIENFMADNAKFNNTDECFQYLLNIKTEWENKYSHMNMERIPDIEASIVTKRILRKCDFNLENSFINRVHILISNAHPDVRKLYYYKNNLFEFSKLDFIVAKFKYICTNLPELHLAELSAIKNEKCREIFEEIWKFYKVFVLYRYPIFDTVRKTLYSEHKAALYIDTDSNFASMSKAIEFISEKVYNNDMGENRDEEEFKVVNLFAIMVTRLLNEAMQMLCDNSNIVEYREELYLKNEFFYKKILFVLVKKRYAAWEMIKEGQIMNGGKGKLDIKGFDFIKASTKSSVKDFYETILLEDILKPKVIDVTAVFMKMVNFQIMIKNIILSGDNQYFKQANVSTIEHYKYPYRIQGVKGSLVWNALVPETQVELPSQVDIIPIKDLGKKKIQEEFAIKFPEQYDRLKTKILQNTNDSIRNMSLDVIAKPIINGFENPEWLNWLIDIDKIINDTTNLFAPVLESIGIILSNLSSKTQVMTNFVSL